MPRRSAADLAIPKPLVEKARLPAPKDLSDAARRIWESIVSTEPSEHFRPSDVPLLRSYTEACAQADEANAALARDGLVVAGKVSAWLAVAEKATRTQNSLSVRLRLSPSARIDPKTKGRSNPEGRLPHEAPWGRR